MVPPGATTASTGPGYPSGMATSGSKGSGRVTPSAKDAAKGATAAKGAASSSVRSDRYTPPVDRSKKVSPKWQGYLIIGLFVLGVLIVILNYAGVLPGGVNNIWLVAAIGSIFAGLIVATRYH